MAFTTKPAPALAGQAAARYGYPSKRFGKREQQLLQTVQAAIGGGIAAAYVTVYGGKYTTTGGAATEVVSIPGAVGATDIAFVQLANRGPNTVTVLSAILTDNTLTVTYSANPGAGAVICYQVQRPEA